MKQLTQEQLQKLNATADFFGETELVDLNGIRLEYHPQSPENALKLMMTIGDLMKNSSELKQIITGFFPQLEDAYSNLNYLALMEVIGIISQKMLMVNPQKNDETK